MNKEFQENREAIFKNVFKVNPSQYYDYGIDIDEVEEDAEAYVCEKTLWHYIHYPNAEKKKYWIIIDRNDQYFERIEDLRDFAYRYYFY
jgi:hypothetical protein